MLSGLWCQSGGYPARPGPCYRPRQARPGSVSERQPPGEERLNITHSDNMDTTSPLMQALRTEHGANIDRGMSDVNTGEMTAVMSYDQVSYLLTVMVTVSVVSILILIFSVTLILGFLW